MWSCSLYFDILLQRLPFACAGTPTNPDNGSEFFNHHMVRYWKDKVKGVHLSRREVPPKSCTT